MADLIVRMRANLTLDTVEALWIEGSDLSGQVRETRCSQVLQRERQRVFCPGEQQEFLQCFDREQLLRRFLAGQRWLCAEYRRVDSGGNVRWVRHVLYLAEEPQSRQVYLFVYLIWLDPGHTLEPAIRAGSRRDGVTRLFRRETVQQIAETLFANRRSGNRAVALLQVNGLPPADAPAGAEADRIRYAIAAALSLALGGSCVLGQYSPHQVVIVFPSVTEKEALRRGLEEAVTFLRRMLAAEPALALLRFLVGIHLMPAATAVYNAMLAQALQVCAFWWNAAVDTVAFSQEAEDWTWNQLPPPGQEDRISVIQPLPAERPLSEREKDVALDCMSVMLSARTLDASLRGVLQTIGIYYRADRVYTLMLVENQRAVIMTFEWTSPSKRSIQQVVSGTLLERFPLLQRCLAVRAPVFLSRQQPIDLAGEGEERRPWYFAALPLIRGRQVEGFLCIENAREHPEDGALFSTLIPFMLQQRERFDAGERPTGTTERLMGLPDLRAYTQAVYSITSEHYSSMGVVCLDIPDFAAVNSGLGFEYGSRLLWYIAKTLTDLFGSALLFRTWESEFVIFYPNTTREVFLAAAAACAPSSSGATPSWCASAGPGPTECSPANAWRGRPGPPCGRAPAPARPGSPSPSRRRTTPPWRRPPRRAASGSTTSPSWTCAPGPWWERRPWCGRWPTTAPSCRQAASSTFWRRTAPSGIWISTSWSRPSPRRSSGAGRVWGCCRWP